MSVANVPPRRNASTDTMMKAAEAISATDITLRDGLKAALRNPRRQIAHPPRPLIGIAWRARSDTESWHMAAARRDPPAPKKVPPRIARFENPAASISTPAVTRSQITARMRGERDETAWPAPMLSADRSARGVSLATDRNEMTTHTTAVMIPAAAPINSDVHETCRNSRDVPTAPIHQVRRPNMMTLPYASAPATPIALPAMARIAAS